MTIPRRTRHLPWLVTLILCSAAVAASPYERRKSLDQAVQELRQRDSGRVISAERNRRNGNEVYNIRILTPDGRVKRYRVDPESGRRIRGR